MDDKPSLADALYPNLSASARARETAEAKQQAWREQSRQSLLRGLKELNESLRADREKGR
jgi:hypothetical protein